MVHALETALERAKTENRILSEMAALSHTGHDYGDVVQTLLDLVEQVVASPLLLLSIQEQDQPAHYIRCGPDTDARWVEDATHAVKSMQSRHLAQRGVPPSGGLTAHSTVPPAWMVSFPVETRSHRMGALALVSSAPVSLAPEEEQVMLRLAGQAVLVLDHVLLLKRIEQLETTDSLTGAGNLRRLIETLEYEMPRHRHSGDRLALWVLDVAGLDGINRAYGRQYGNHVLRKLASLAQEVVRPVDTVCRYGLDDFAVVLPEMDEEDGRSMAERLQERFVAVEFAGGDIGLRSGVAHVKPEESLTAEELLWRAEQALRETKRQERDWTALWQGAGRRQGSL